MLFSKVTDYTTSAGSTATSSGMMYIRIFSLVKIEVLKKCILTPKIIFVLLESVIDGMYKVCVRRHSWRQTALHITSHKVEYIFESNKQNDKISLWKLSLLAIAIIYNLNYSKNQRVRTTIFPSQPGNVLNIYWCLLRNQASACYWSKS